ncbi:MAG TPA: amino acid adenylation domain-containing protein, partial [Ktedonobacteraceae bacterium]|nr:amino acid adenylation domain-containing protein [Ktedonobacteraceae bacterium]
MKIDNKNKITRNALEDMYPLAPMQQGILFHSLYAPQSGVYFMQLSVTLHGNLNVAAFQRTWQEIQQRHPILRTAFNWEHREEPFQIVYRQAKLHWHEHDWRTFSRQEQIEQLQTFIQADREKGFDLTRAPLMRLNLIRLADESYHFLWSHHHLLLDGWSCGLLLKEVFGLYELLQAEKSGAFSPCPPYGDYISWLQRQDMTQARAYWQRTLQGFHTATPLPAEQNNTGWQTQVEESATQKIALSPQLTKSLQQFSKQQSLTVNTLLQAAWALLLKNYTGKKDVIFGTVVSGRPLEIEHIDTMVGLFCNTLPTRIQMHDDETLLPWLKTIQQQQAEQRQFEHSPLLQIQRWSDMPRGSSLFDSIMVFENYPMDKYMQDQVHSLTIEDAHFLERTNYPFSIQAIPGEDLLIRLDYDRRRFSDEAIQRLLRHLQTLLETFIAHPEYQLWQVSPLTQEERHQILVAWNETAQTYPQEQCLPQLFEAQVERSPHALALRFQQQELTYAQLNAQANQLAHALIQLGVGPERIVALHLQRCPELVIAILAVLKAEGAYLPLEPSLPGERVSTLLQQSRPHLVLTQQHLRSLLPEDQSPIFCLETLWPQLQALPTSNPPCSILPAHLAYVLFTSGSTGLPKGVMIPHQGLVNYLSWAISAYQADAGNGSPVHSPLGFDLTVTSLFTPLLCGRPVLLLPPSHELEALLDVLQQGPHFSLLKLTPAHLTLLNQWLTPEQAATCTQALIVGGEELLGEQVRFWQERAPNVRLINEYGPTETVVGCCTYEVPAHEHFTSGIPIGRPIANTQLYVLDPFLQPVPPEVAGELYIGGAGLARGYFQQADLSAERFVPHPFSHQPGARLYRTGDLASYQQDGTLTFLGRIDQQVKLRGYRIELGEIENVLARHALVQDTVVLLREDHPGDKRLVAYVVPAREIANLGQFTGILQQYMRERLPEYMLPVAFVLLEQLPLTANGKIDRQSLPEPEERRSTQQNFVATRSPIQQQLGVLWEEVLKIDTVGIHDNFFALGGHSLLLTQLATRIRKTFQLDLPLPTLFQAATLAHMTEALENALREQHHLPPEEPILPVARDQALPLSFAQQRLWFLQQLNPDSSAYTIPVFVRLSGKLSLSALEQALNYVIQRHETLRTTFSTDNNQAVQIIQPYTYFTLLIVDLTVSAPTAEHVQRILGEEAMRPFDLTHELPWRACLYRQSADEHVLAFCMHHIVSDAWSSGILVQEISTFYAHLCAGMSAELPDLTVQYADFAVWQRSRLQGENLQALHSYWRKQLADAPEVLNLPTDYARPTMQTFQGSTEHFVLLPELTHELNRLAHKEQVTLFMLLIAAFNVLLYHYSQQSDILLGVPIANRTREETEKLIGVFMNTLVLRHQLQPQQSFRELLTVVRNTTLEAYAHQDLPFEALIEELAPARSMGHHPLFQVMFVLQNAPMPAVELTDLHIQSLEIENGMTKFDLTLFMEEQADGLRGMFEYNTALFKASTIRRFQEHFCSLLQRIVQEPKELIWRLTPLDEAEQQVILYQWNETEHEYPQEQCLPQLFEAQVERSPHALALCFQQQELTYAQLNAQANQLAHALIQLGVGPELIVALHLQRCPELVIAILAVLKAGGAYLPLEPSLPGERLSTLLQQSQPYLVLTQQHLCALLPEDQSPIFCLEALWPQLQALPTCNPTCSILPAHLAYVLFTSGSTGLPKGVMIPHQGLVNYLSWATSAYQADAGNGSPIHSPLGFDLTVTSLFTPLLCGRPVLLLPPSHELEALLDVLQQGPHFSLLKLTPAHLTLLNQWLTPEQAATCTQALIVGGEELLGEQVRFWQEHAPNVRLINEYGPTETVVGCCTYEVPAHEHFTSGIPIGRPIANTQLYVLDPFLQPVPPGVAGELYIGGAGLARGYFQQADLSAARFVPHPFSREAGARLYRTGDLASYQQNGTLTFLGRIDQQVKLRGYRIELGEIENVLKQHLLIQDAVVLLREDHPGDKRLVAYVVPAPETTDQ